jgi:aspartate kinase
MRRIVLKFGGTSVADVDRIRHVACLVKDRLQPDVGIAIVTSAMAGVTNQYVAWSDAIGVPNDGLGHRDDEYDVVTSSGEQVTAGLLAMALRHVGVRARSWLGWQAAVHTDGVHGKARIADVVCNGLATAIDAGEVAVVAGFQGLSPDGRITTLGRGGSDTSAVALAAALKAELCDIYTDVDGVYTTDPRVEVKARRLPRLSYGEMLEMAAMGAKVLMPRSVELAMAHQVPLRVLSSFSAAGTNAGTLICGEDTMMEQRIVSGIAFSADEARLTLVGLPDQPGVVAHIFGLLADANITVDMVTEARDMTGGTANLGFCVARRELARAGDVLAAAQDTLGYTALHTTSDLAKVSVIGVGLRSHMDVSKTLFEALAAKSINVQAIATAEIKISVLIETAYLELAVRTLHAAFGLDAVTT